MIAAVRMTAGGAKTSHLFAVEFCTDNLTPGWFVSSYRTGIVQSVIDLRFEQKAYLPLHCSFPGCLGIIDNIEPEIVREE
jgi:hypothetical protein